MFKRYFKSMRNTKEIPPLNVFCWIYNFPDTNGGPLNTLYCVNLFRIGIALLSQNSKTANVV